jgi:hypothetical protein
MSSSNHPCTGREKNHNRRENFFGEVSGADPVFWSKGPGNQREKQGLPGWPAPPGEIGEKRGPQRFSRWFILVYLLCRDTINPKRGILNAMIVRRLHGESLIIV